MVIGSTGNITRTSAARTAAMGCKSEFGNQAFFTAQSEIIIAAPVNGILTVPLFILVGKPGKMLRTFIHLQKIAIGAFVF